MDTHKVPRSVEKRKPESAAIEGQVSKQARTDMAGDVHVQNGTQMPVQAGVEKVSQNLKYLNHDQLADIVREAIVAHPDVSVLVDSTIQALRDRESRRVHDFDYYSKSIWRSMNVTYGRLSGSKQTDMTSNMHDEILSAVQDIADCCGPFANPDTRYNGLSVLRKIGKTIALSTDTIGREIRQCFDWDSSLEEGMLEILSQMDSHELQDVRNDDETPDGLWPKLLELERLASSAYVFPRFTEVMDVLRGSEEEENEDESEEDNEYDKDDEDDAE